jgi:hypothetical protein
LRIQVSDQQAFYSSDTDSRSKEDSDSVINSRPFGIIFLAVLAMLGAGMACFMTLQVLINLPHLSGYISVELPDIFLALIFVLLVLAFSLIAYGFLMIDLTDWYSVIGVSILNFAIIILSGISLAITFVTIMMGFPWSKSLSMVVVNGCILTYCVLLDNKKAFWSPGRESIRKEPKPL